MSVQFGSDFFAGNRERLRQLFTGTAPIVLTANGSLQKSGDEAYRFHQDRSFWYLTGIDEPDVILVMDKSKEYLIVPGRDAIKETFDGRLVSEKLSSISGIKDVLNDKDGWKQLEARIKKVQHVATLAAPPKYVTFWGMYTNPARTELISRLKEANSAIEFLDLRQHLSRMRMVKQPIEIEAIREAVDITVSTLKEACRRDKLGRYGFEYELEAEITRGFRKRGAEGHGFDPIVAGGELACTMHYFANSAPLSSDELVLIDVGAQASHYTADIARTYSVGGQPSRRQQQVYDAVCEAQDYCYSLLKPGVVIREYEKQMEQFVGEKLRELGLIKSITKEVVRQHFPHMATHFLGLDTHDAGDYDHPIEPGVVGVAELGIYIPEEGIGVRIEDDILITADGVENLSAALPRTL